MYFEKFFGAISKLLPGGADLDAKAIALSSLDPDKIYVENVRSVLGVSNAEARRICETATRQGVFSKRIEVLCPDGSVAASADTVDDLPEVVHCWTEEGGHFEETDFQTTSLQKNVYYRLNEQVVPSADA